MPLLFNSKPKLQIVNESQYVPNRFGLPTNSTLAGVSEFFVYLVKRNEEDIPEKILQLFQSHNGHLISASVYPGNDPKTDSVIDCIMDTSRMDCQPDDLLIVLRKMRSVKRADKVKMGGQLFSNYLFPIVAAGNKRAVVIDAAGLLELENSTAKSDPSAGKIVSEKLFEQGRVQGLGLAKEFATNDIAQNKQAEFMSAASKSYLRAAGWGIIGFSLERDIFMVNVSEPPFVSQGGVDFVGGSYMKGLIAGMLEFQLEKEAKLAVTHESYNKEKKILSLYFAEETVANEAAEAKAKLEAELEISESLDPSTVMDEPDLEVTSTPAMGAQEVPTAISTKNDKGQKESASDLGNLEIVRKILTVSKTGALKVNLMHSTRITLSEAKEYVQNMVKAGLLEIKRVGGTEAIMYQTTEKGQDYLDAHERLSNMLEQDFPDTRIITKAQG